MKGHDQIDRILNGETEAPLALVTPQFLVEVVDRYVFRALLAASTLPPRPTSPEDEDAYEAEIEFQERFQEAGASLLPAMTALTKVIMSSPTPVGAVLLARLSQAQPAMFFWDYMVQHTEIGKFKDRLGA